MKRQLIDFVKLSSLKMKDTRLLGLENQVYSVCISDNFDVALRRMKSLVRRLQADVNLLQKYDGIIRQQLDQGVTERVDNSIP